MSDELLSQSGGPIHRLALNRPARRNALTPDLARRLAQEIEHVEEAAGLDLHWLSSLRGRPSIADLQHGLSDFQSAVIAIVRCPIPVLAVVQGTAAGFGFDLALACDMRLAGSSASFTSAFARMGLVPDGGSTFTLPRLVGVGRALRVLMTNQTLDAATALSIGLVEEVIDDATLDDGVLRIVAELLASADSSIRAIKRLCRAPEVGALEQALSTEGAAQLQALQGPDFLLRLEAFTVRASARSEGA